MSDAMHMTSHEHIIDYIDSAQQMPFTFIMEPGKIPFAIGRAKRTISHTQILNKPNPRAQTYDIEIISNAEPVLFVPSNPVLQVYETDFACKLNYAFFPIFMPKLLEYYGEQKNAHWVPTDIDMRQDRPDFDVVESDIQETIIGFIAFFVPSDGIVNENIFERFQRDTSFWKEAKAFYAAQAFMETIHSEMYSIMAQVLIRDAKTLHSIYYAEHTFPCVARIAQFMKKYMDDTLPLADRIIAFACVEGVLFTSAFAYIRWLKKRNVMRGFCKANEFIARDEAIHTRFAVALYLLASKHQKLVPAAIDRAYHIVSEAVDVNKQFIEDIIKVDRIGMSAKELVLYTKCTADALLVSLGHEKLYNVENPFDWMAIISLPNKTNFFEDKVSEYAQQTEEEFVFDEDAYF